MTAQSTAYQDSLSAAEQVSSETCRDQRRRVLKSGIICFNDRHCTVGCTVRDLSETGAKLKTAGSVNAPDSFELHIELDGIWVNCEVVWRSGETLGVIFVSDVEKKAPTRIQSLIVTTEQPKLSLRRRPRN